MNSSRSMRADILVSSLASVLPRLDAAPLAGKRLLITGGTGFFGLWLLAALDRLQCQGCGMRATVLSRDPARFLAAQPQWRDLPWLSFVRGNVRDFDWPAARFELLIHAAADTSMSAHAAPEVLLDDITEGTHRVLEFAVEAGVHRALLVSSGAVYGPRPVSTDCIAEDAAFEPLPESGTYAYARGKRVMESLAASFRQRHGIAAVIARCFAFSGPGLPLDAHFAIGNFIRDALFADAIRVHGDGAPLRSYLHGADLAVWLLRLLTAGDPGEAYNVGSDRAIRVADLAVLVGSIVAPGKQVHVENLVAAPGDPRRSYVPCIRKARDGLGLDAWTALEDSIRMATDYALAGTTPLLSGKA